MRILQLANFVHDTSGGMGKAMESLAREYRARGHVVMTVIPGTAHESVDGRLVRIPGPRVPMTGGYRVIRARRPVADLIDEFCPDIVELSDKTTLSWVVPWCASRGIHVTVVSHERADEVVRRGPLVARVVLPAVSHWRRGIERFADLIVCASEYAAAEFTRSSRVFVTPLGVDADTFTVAHKSSMWGEPLRLVTCGRLSPEKRPELAVETLRVLNGHMDVELIIAGDGPLRDVLERRAKGLPVRFLGSIADRADVARHLGGADVVLNMGPHETFGLVTLESLACGTPVVVADHGGSREVLSPGCGHACAGEPLEIASRVLDIVSGDKVSIARRCREHAINYTWAATAEAILARSPGGGGMRRAG